MRVITNFSRIYFDDPIQNFELNKFSIKKSNLNVYIGEGCKFLLVNKFNYYYNNVRQIYNKPIYKLTK